MYVRGPKDHVKEEGFQLYQASFDFLTASKRLEKSRKSRFETDSITVIVRVRKVFFKSRYKISRLRDIMFGIFRFMILFMIHTTFLLQ